MKDVKIDRRDSLDLHEQVAGEIRRAIADGEARPGERLPPARDLAAVLGVNTNTVLRALCELRDEGMLEFRRGRGITVTGTPRARRGRRAREGAPPLRAPARLQAGRAHPDHPAARLTAARKLRPRPESRDVNVW